MLLWSGCQAPPRPIPPPLPEPSEQMLERAKEFREQTKDAPRRWVVIDAVTMQAFETRYELLSRALLNLGFQEAVLNLVNEKYLIPDQEEYKQLRELLGELAAKKIPVRLMLRQGNFYNHNMGLACKDAERFPWFCAALALEESLREIPVAERPVGLMLALEPQRFTKQTLQRPRRLLFAWDEKLYGVGLDNDLIMRLTLDDVAELRRRLTLPVTTVLPAFVHDAVLAGKLSVGRSDDPVLTGTLQVISAYGDKPTAVLSSIDEEFAARSAHPQSVMVELLLAGHIHESNHALRRRDWNDLMGMLRYGMARWQKNPAFGGVLFNSLYAFYGVLEQ